MAQNQIWEDGTRRYWGRCLSYTWLVSVRGSLQWIQSCTWLGQHTFSPYVSIHRHGTYNAPGKISFMEDFSQFIYSCIQALLRCS